MEFKDIKLFGNTTYEDLIKDIYKKSSNKDLQITSIIAKLAEQIKSDPQFASVILPSLVEYEEASIKNNEQLIKLAGVIQRFFAKGAENNGDSSDLLSDSDKEMILKELKVIKQESNN